ncbi:hypothetical protein TVAG_476220 [Trichomonas vaginalis G3]|uniref:Thioredoxin domain-containing protein n=1 Tax=Trichomonas vaginalis (strain ATCC PRA-98 / G3) TaxID=412133 RepID=A2DA45_TRIV3|nr:thioredoxin domain-containing protein 16 family [Trichomonas vaginalis G3]EAY22693.1 hypothetical protein TVAG_476220 [Trichomonas vaginalis G3]KAI5525506.1 thioredoxin domain-containing protein 16 family [Trichomonas vaginalis G3]|eukprot:XP_001583679.1 hypothetical protein [Trichomonas vaginalis G3]
MFFFLSTQTLSTYIDRSELDTEFIKVLDDRTMRDTIKKSKNSFVLFHADHLRMSDSAYLSYASIAKKYEKKADFYVVPASNGADVSRTYNVPGNPTLMHFNFGTKTGQHLGMYSKSSIERFIQNYTTTSIIELNFAEDVTKQQILDKIAESTVDRPHCIVLFCDNETQFGRAAYKTQNDLGTFYTYINIKSEAAAKAYGARWPSIVFMRFDDAQTFTYTKEADPDEMFIWIQHCAIPNFRPLDPAHLFSMDGVPLKSVISFLDTSDNKQYDDVFMALGKISNDDKWINLYYVDIRENPALVKLFGITEFPSTIYLSANYSIIKFYSEKGALNEETYKKFESDELKYSIVPTPEALFDDLRPVNEIAFEKMLQEGPFFTFFNSRFCVKCKTMKAAVFDAVHTIRRNSGKLKFASWDITLATPSFQKDLDIGIPSLYYYPDNNMTHGEVYVGPQNYLSIMEWVNAKTASFDLDDVMNKEVGGSFDEI